MKKTIIVFDMDETLGYFSDIGTLYFFLKDKGVIHTNQEFFKILDQYPELLNVNILQILKYVKQKKDTKKANKIIIYTNNISGKDWPDLISKYFNYKLKTKLFDDVIAGFLDFEGNVIDYRRTSQMKHYGDLQKILKLNTSSKNHIFFADDVYHEFMFEDNIYYAKVEPYKLVLSYSNFVNRLEPIFDKETMKVIKEEYKPYYNIRKYNKPIITEKDIQNTNTLFKELKYFFTHIRSDPTRKQKKRSNKNKTQKSIKL